MRKQILVTITILTCEEGAHEYFNFIKLHDYQPLLESSINWVAVYIFLHQSKSKLYLIILTLTFDLIFKLPESKSAHCSVDKE